MPQWATLKTIYLQHTKGLTTGAHVKGPKKDICPKSRDGNIATHKVDISSLMKSSIEFCYGGGAREPLWAPRLGLTMTSTNADFQIHLYEKPYIPFESSQKVI